MYGFDNVFNVMFAKEDSQKVISKLYYDKCISLDRKFEAAKQVLAWKRPEKKHSKNVI
jgi:hypothetical protein